MRKTTMSLLVVLSLWGATSWQPPQPLPQWTVVAERRMRGETDFQSFTLFTPGENKTYRFSGVCSATGDNSSTWTFTLHWVDVSGNGVNSSVMCSTEGWGTTSQAVFMFLPKAMPIELSASFSESPSSYNAAFTIEELQ